MHSEWETKEGEMNVEPWATRMSQGKQRARGR